MHIEILQLKSRFQNSRVQFVVLFKKGGGDHIQNIFVVLFCQQPSFCQQSAAHFSEFNPVF